jgi:hypothetical protein
MDSGGKAHRRVDGQAADSPSRLRESEGMARWRWGLFAIMARFEADEGVYLRIPNASATSCHGSTRGAVAGVVRRILRALRKKPRSV